MTHNQAITDIKEAALAWYDAGCSVIPIRPDGTKRPNCIWGDYQTTPASRTQIHDWFHNKERDPGIGVICGNVSGNLEMLELEGRAAAGDDLTRIAEQCEAHGVADEYAQLLTHGYAEWTPSGGLHLLYRIADHPVPGNTKVARRPATISELVANPDDKIKVMAETRGEGGYVIVAPTGGTVHPTGDSWTTVAGRIGDIPTITWDVRNRIHQAVHAALDTMPAAPPPRPNLATIAATAAGGRPGDDYNERVDWPEILQPLGWQIHHTTHSETFWTRPGKPRSEGHSATTGLMGTGAVDRLYVFSSSTEFEPGTPYTKFHAYTLLHHAGDFSAAARTLRAAGYGDTPNLPAATYTSGTITPPTPTTATPATRDAIGLPTYTDTQLTHHDWDGNGIPELWQQLHRDTFTYIPTQKKWMMWQGTRWGWDNLLRHERSMVLLSERMKDHARQLAATDPDRGTPLLKEARRFASHTLQQAALKTARSHPNIAAQMQDFDKDPNLVTVDNGVLNLQTLNLQPHDPKLMLTRKVNSAYQPDAAPGRWQQFMEEVLPDAEVRAYLQRACGYMLTGQMTERVLFLLRGETGSGKSQFLEALTAVLGDFAGVAPSSAFQPRQPGYKGPTEDLHKLMGKRLVIQSELDAGTKLNESLVKSITGADTQTTRTLYGEPVDWQPEYTVFMATNYLPRISSSDNAIWTRVKTVWFTEKFVDENGAALNPDDKGLGRRMAAEEPEAIFNWLIEGLLAYRQHGLAEPAQVAEWLREYRDEVDTTRQYLLEAPQEGRITIDADQEISVRDNYRTYVAWCTDNGVTPVGMKGFNERLMSAGWVKEKRAKGIFWQGIGLAGFIAAAMTPVNHWANYIQKE